MPILDAMAARWKAILAENRRNSDEVIGVALAFAGVVDARSRRVVATNDKFTDAPAIDLEEWAQRVMGLPIEMDNDARVALLGEWQAGAGRGADDLVMVTLGTGIGAAAVSDGRIIRGGHGMAGIFGGHLTVNYAGRRCTCGNIGCAEAEASTDRLAELVRDVAHAGGMNADGRDTEPFDYARIFALADAGDALAASVRDRSVAVWSAMVVNLIHAYGPQRVVMGGGIARGAPWLIKAIRQHVDQHAWMPWGNVEIRLAELGDDAALIGGAELFQSQGSRAS